MEGGVGVVVQLGKRGRVGANGKRVGRRLLINTEERVLPLLVLFPLSCLMHLHLSPPHTHTHTHPLWFSPRTTHSSPSSR